MRVIQIVEGTSVDGPGLRTSVYFAGCLHQCPGCHNPQTWDFDAGNDMNIDDIVAVVRRNGWPVTFTGGDPLYQLHDLTRLAAALKRYNFNIWCYTGFVYEDLASQPRYARLLRNIDVLVDGPYIEAQRDLTLPFRGSRNQRIINLRH